MSKIRGGECEASQDLAQEPTRLRRLFTSALMSNNLHGGSGVLFPLLPSHKPPFTQCNRSNGFGSAEEGLLSYHGSHPPWHEIIVGPLGAIPSCEKNGRNIGVPVDESVTSSDRESAPVLCSAAGCPVPLFILW